MNNVDFTETTQQSILSIGPGQCGIERGIERALQQKVNVVAFVEIEAFIIENLLALMEQGILDSAPVWTNVKTFPYRRFRNKVHGITAGYPCQPFSVAGNRKGANDPRHLWPYISRIMQSVRPFWGFFENVAGHLNLGFEEVSRDLRKMGYHVEAGIYTAEEVGAPHQRERLFILAVDKSEIRRFREMANSNIIESTEERRNTSKVSKLSKEKRTKFNSSLSGRTSNYELKELGNSQHDGQPTSSELRSCNEASNNKKKGEDGSGKSKGTDRRNSSTSLSGCEEMANTGSKGLQRIERSKKHNRKDEKGTTRPNGAITERSFNKWPSKPGQEQQDWEEPRTIKSSMGCTINGYNFREDLLRMYGNGVVEQTAELAWIELWNKIINV